MVFNVTWQLKFTSNDRKPKFWTKRSDRGNQNMYLLDNLGQRYDHIRGGGAAYTREGVWGGDLHTGWFEFPPAPPGAITFYFYDDDLEQVIRNIPLIQPDVVFLEFPLANKDLVMDFPQDEWKIFETPEGKVSLANEKIPECRLNEKASELEGKTLNTMNLGSTTYQISSYNDSQTKDPVRDYQAVEIDGIIENLPVITLSLPDGDPQACIFAASKILASLSERQEVVIPTPILITPSTTPDPTLETAANNETSSTATPAGPPTEVQPGYYPVNACDSVQHDKIETATIRLCILNLIVYADRSVLANISLEVKNPYKWAYRKKSDLGNAEVYLMDKKGNRYIQKAGSDLLYQEILIRAGERVDGWYKFPTIASDAFEISFFNDRQGFAISRIFLREPVILTGEFPLSNSQFELEYLHGDWELSESEGQSPILKNKKIEGCFFQEYLEKELKGKLKNTTVLGGNLVYKIYGYLEPSSNTGYREYQFAGGLPISDGSTYPTFLVTIPLEEQQKCIFDASELLGNLTIRQEE